MIKVGMIKVTDIKWDTDNDKDIFKSLPQEIIISDDNIPVYVDPHNDDELAEFISDYITDETGFCHYGFNYTIAYKAI